ncbi:MAG TPA: YihY/virulence factor BrkB family protein [Verrucomicrobiae bacterium]|nr:YihY/virulence factor BrkB family protein [Verrucomicrobiae bacterium]
MKRKFKSIYRHVLQVISIWTDANAPAMGAATAFYTIFAIAPLFVLVLALAGLCFGKEAAQHELFGQISSLVGQKSADAIQSVLAAANRPKAGMLATICGFITLFLGASGVFIQLQQSLDAIWNVRPKSAGWRSFLKNRLLSFASLLTIGFLLLVSLVVSAAITAAGNWLQGTLPAPHVVLHIVNFVISLGIVTLLFAMMFKILPDVKIRWRDVWIGAFITALLFTIGKFLIGLYLGRGSVSSAYGAAGSFVVVLLWVYYSVQLLLFGAASTRIYANEFGSHIRPSENAEFTGQKKKAS